MKSRITTVVEVLGFGLFILGVGLIYVPAGVIAAGLVCLGVGYLVGDGDV